MDNYAIVTTRSGARVEKGEVAVSSLAVVLGALILLSPAACTVHRDYRLALAIQQGADPIAARCAFEDSRTLCIAYAVGKAIAR